MIKNKEEKQDIHINKEIVKEHEADDLKEDKYINEVTVDSEKEKKKISSIEEDEIKTSDDQLEAIGIKYTNDSVQ